ncbi:MAG: type IV toxin-antitoxin system AbiEi family antitoxin domain-containing protein [Dehalococcoidia bacterium]|jgi:predicted transcriptional regulator of viral defense system
MSDIKAASRTRRPASQPDRARLFDIASEQGGYFTAEQARVSGFSRSLVSHHVKSGRFIRVRRGLYRFREYPASPREHVLAAWLAVGKDVAVVSHESALDLLDLSDVIPDAVHLTVPRSRRNVLTLPGVKVHTTARSPRSEDVVVRDSIAITSATRSILDAAETGIAPEQVEMAVIQAVERGLATPRQLRQDAVARGRRVATLIEEALRRFRQ